MVSCLLKTTPFVESINAYVQDGSPAPGGGIVCTYRCQPIGLGRIPQPPPLPSHLSSFSPLPRFLLSLQYRLKRRTFTVQTFALLLSYPDPRFPAAGSSLHRLSPRPDCALLALPRNSLPRILKQPERPVKGFGFGSLI